MDHQPDPGFYDPQEDPRYMGLTREEQAVEEAQRANQLAELDVHAETLRVIQDLFEHPGWVLLDEALRNDLNLVRRGQSDTRDQLLFVELKGKADAYEALLAMPLKMRKDLARTLGEIEAFELEGETDEHVG